VLHLGNINFAKGKESDSSVIKDDKSRFHISTAAELLMYGFSGFPSLNSTHYILTLYQLAFGMLITGVIVRS
jgi:hypothetical protein